MDNLRLIVLQVSTATWTDADRRDSLVASVRAQVPAGTGVVAIPQDMNLFLVSDGSIGSIGSYATSLLASGEGLPLPGPSQS